MKKYGGKCILFIKCGIACLLIYVLFSPFEINISLASIKYLTGWTLIFALLFWFSMALLFVGAIIGIVNVGKLVLRHVKRKGKGSK